MRRPVVPVPAMAAFEPACVYLPTGSPVTDCYGFTPTTPVRVRSRRPRDAAVPADRRRGT